MKSLIDFDFFRRPKRAAVIGGVIAAPISLVVVGCMWPPPENERFRDSVLLVGGTFGLWFGCWRCITADENLKQERYRIGSELLNWKNHDYVSRVAGAATLAELARTDPKNYDAKVMKAFEAFLTFPPKFGSQIEKHREGEIDYESQDTVEIVRAINERTRGQRGRYRISLPRRAPFLVVDSDNEDGHKPDNVEPNPHHPDYRKWIEATDKPPAYR